MADTRLSDPATPTTIGPFVLDPQAEMLLRDRTPLPLGRRAVGVLRMLVAHAGDVVTKEDLLSGVWGGLAVEEGNLTAQVAALRRALSQAPGGVGWIETLPRRGYRFVGPVDAPMQAGASNAPAPIAADGMPSLAVLTFRVLGAAPVATHMADGIAEDIVSSLAGLPELTVISRGSTHRLRSPELDLAQIGRELGVRYLVSGSIRQTGDRLRVIAELVEAANGAIVTSRVQEVAPDAIFSAHDDIVAAIVRALVPRIRDEELRRIRLKPPESMLAYDLVVQARGLMHRLDRESFDTAQPLLDRAMADDPGYAPAYALAAELHSLHLAQGWATDRQATQQKIKRYAQMSVQQDPNDPRGLAWSAHASAMFHRDYDTAMTQFARALERAPSHAEAWMWSSVTLSFIGEADEAVARGERALRLSPRDWFGFRFLSTLCLAHYTAGRYAEAARWGRAALAENPRYFSNVGYTAAALVGCGELEQARSLALDWCAMHPGLSVADIVERHPYRDPMSRARYGQHLLEAGAPR